jgi:hypothetical protein
VLDELRDRYGLQVRVVEASEMHPGRFDIGP